MRLINTFESNRINKKRTTTILNYLIYNTCVKKNKQIENKNNLQFNLILVFLLLLFNQQ